MATPHSANRNSPLVVNKNKSKNDPQMMNAINNNILRTTPRRQAALFAKWFCKLIDNDRSVLSLYLSNDAVMQWFGRTIKTKEKVSGFLKYDMHFTHHRFTSVEACGPFSLRGESEITDYLHIADDEEDLALPLEGVTPPSCQFTLDKPQTPRALSTKRRREFSSSPESPTLQTKRSKITQSPQNDEERNHVIRKSPKLTKSVDNMKKLDEGLTVLEEGQGDCVPSTSGTKNRIPQVADQSVDYVAQLPRCYAEMKCIIDFTKTRNKRGAELMKWERQCKLQVAYTENPMYPNEYVIWTIVYSDNNKCRRNLLAAFEAVSLEQEKNNNSSL